MASPTPSSPIVAYVQRDSRGFAPPELALPPDPLSVDRSPFAQPMAEELHPVQVEHVRRYLLALDANLAGRYASPAFRTPLSDLEVRWALETRGQGTGVLEDRSADEARALTLLGAAMSMSAEDLLMDTLAESPALSTAHRAVRTLTNPSLRVGGNTGGKKVAVGAPMSAADRNAALSMAALEQQQQARGPRRPQASVRSGAGLQFRGLNDDEETPLVDGAAYIVGQRVVVDAWRISGLVVERAWSAYARQHVWAGWHVTAATVSRKDIPVPGNYTLGTLTDLPGAWQLRTYARHVLPQPEKSEELKVGFEVRALWRWRAPQRPDGWGLGDRIPYDGPYVPGSRDWESYELTRQPAATTPAPAIDDDTQLAQVDPDEPAAAP